MAECILIALQFARKMKPPCNPRRRNCHFFIIYLGDEMDLTALLMLLIHAERQQLK